MYRTSQRSLGEMFPLAAVLYCALALYFLPRNIYSLDPDGISYILLAQKYVRGEFAAAVNGTWQPLFSWLLAPLLALHAQPQAAGYLLLAASGLLTLVAFMRLLKVLPLEGFPAGVLLIAFVAPVLQFTFVLVTPDLLLTALMLFYFSAALDPAYPAGRRPLACGLFAGLAYLAKAYALPFFLVHFALLNLFTAWRTGQRRACARAFVSGTAVCLLVAAPWIALISAKYGHFTVSTAAAFNWSASNAGKVSIPQGFFPPPNGTALSVWEDPGMIRFSALRREPSLRRMARSVLLNARDTVRILDRFSPVILAVLILGLVAAASRTMLRREPAPALLLFSAALFMAGYLPVNVEVRYIWTPIILLAALGFVLCSKLGRTAGSLAPARNLLIFLLAATLIAWPLNKMKFRSARDNQLQKVCRMLSAQGVRGRIASSDAWIDSLYIAYFLNSSYYGKKPQGMAEEEVRRQLARFDIDYYFVWQPGPVPAFLAGARELDAGRIRGLRVFRLRKEGPPG